MFLTIKQIELMKVIVAANPDGTATDLDQIIERVSYKPSKQSIQFSIRALIKHGFIEKLGEEKRRDRHRVLIGATKLGKHFAGPPSSASVISSLDEEELLESLSIY